MRAFLDTEFIENGVTIRLVSIAIVITHDNGNPYEDYYAESVDAIGYYPGADPWVKTNVLRKLKHMNGDEQSLRTNEQIKNDILSLLHPALGKPEVWAYYADYDWVVLCQLFGRMIDLPSYFPKYCLDLKQLAVSKGNPDLRALVPVGNEHNALSDARWNLSVYNALQDL